jgi:hypothetical protein
MTNGFGHQISPIIRTQIRMFNPNWIQAHQSPLLLLVDCAGYICDSDCVTLHGRRIVTERAPQDKGGMKYANPAA